MSGRRLLPAAASCTPQRSPQCSKGMTRALCQPAALEQVFDMMTFSREPALAPRGSDCRSGRHYRPLTISRQGSGGDSGPRTTTVRVCGLNGARRGRCLDTGASPGVRLVQRAERDGAADGGRLRGRRGSSAASMRRIRSNGSVARSNAAVGYSGLASLGGRPILPRIADALQGRVLVRPCAAVVGRRYASSRTVVRRGPPLYKRAARGRFGRVSAQRSAQGVQRSRLHASGKRE
jgi:hypothetical protein